MKRLDSRTVEFTTLHEAAAHKAFNNVLDKGAGIPEAAVEALTRGLANGARFSNDFVEYLSEDTVMVTHGRTPRAVLTDKGRKLS